MASTVWNVRANSDPNAIITVSKSETGSHVVIRAAGIIIGLVGDSVLIISTPNALYSNISGDILAVLAPTIVVVNIPYVGDATGGTMSVTQV